VCACVRVCVCVCVCVCTTRTFSNADSPAEHRAKLLRLAEAIKKDRDVYIEDIKIDRAAGIVRRTALINGEARKDSGELKI
jgi:hypothetical protein